jgi:hypothetical protein
MSILYFILVFVIIVGMTWWVGSWNIMLNLTNFFIASLLACSFYEPLADRLEAIDRTFTYIVDFAAIWLIFVVACALLRMATDFLTSYQLRMNFWAEMGLRTVLSIWLGLAFCFFTSFTLHLAPLPNDALVSSPTTDLFGFAPDRKWMAFVQSRSRGALAESKEGMFLPTYDLVDHPDDRELNARVFDPHAKFAETYIQRRIKLSKSETLRVHR